MRATGIVRRIDDLGRIIIPKSIRRDLGICEGDPLELFLNRDMVCFQKYHIGYADQLENIASRVRDDMIDYDLSSRLSDAEVKEIFEKLNELNDIVKLFKEKSI